MPHERFMAYCQWAFAEIARRAPEIAARRAKELAERLKWIGRKDDASPARLREAPEESTQCMQRHARYPKDRIRNPRERQWGTVSPKAMKCFEKLLLRDSWSLLGGDAVSPRYRKWRTDVAAGVIEPTSAVEHLVDTGARDRERQAEDAERQEELEANWAFCKLFVDTVVEHDTRKLVQAEGRLDEGDIAQRRRKDESKRMAAEDKLAKRVRDNETKEAAEAAARTGQDGRWAQWGLKRTSEKSSRKLDSRKQRCL